MTADSRILVPNICFGMRMILAISATLLGLALFAQAGGPILMTRGDVFRKADLIVVAKIGGMELVPSNQQDDPFAAPGASRWHLEGFSHCAEARVEQIISGPKIERFLMLGGRVGVLGPRWLEEGRYLLCLARVGEGSYAAVDWRFSHMPMEGDAVDWLLPLNPSEAGWRSEKVPLEEAVRRIQMHRNQSEQAAGANP